ncbi:MAG: peptidoglycan-associated lipoprotein Pal [bacterium]
MLFEFDKAEILAEYKAVIQENATKLLDNPSMVATIEGHADERGTNEYNLALGQRRAEAIRDALIESGVPPSQLQTITFGEERPSDLGHNEEAWRLNRRGEMVVNP